MNHQRGEDCGSFPSIRGTEREGTLTSVAFSTSFPWPAPFNRPRLSFFPCILNFLCVCSSPTRMNSRARPLPPFCGLTDGRGRVLQWHRTVLGSSDREGEESSPSIRLPRLPRSPVPLLLFVYSRHSLNDGSSPALPPSSDTASPTLLLLLSVHLLSPFLTPPDNYGSCSFESLLADKRGTGPMSVRVSETQRPLGREDCDWSALTDTHRQNIRTWMLSGRDSRPAAQCSSQLGRY
ncbi:unnamed protein product [Pleuronectes platessa]|uniref:Uncharacterized protein n=1 Tax=Pleuronectes platessa TaxID=8262 RepID=A0A9N7Z2V0_PLEPL|nr:unnamed protein product [Pleuronectes platessa]